MKARPWIFYATLPLRGRDLRFNLIRGLANWAIFLDQIPHEVFAYDQELRFSDAADLFVFISGYSAALVFGRIMIERGAAAAASGLIRRASQLYERTSSRLSSMSPSRPLTAGLGPSSIIG